METTTRMTAAAMVAARQFELRSRQRPQVKPGEVLIRSHYCGLCSSDLGVWSNPDVQFDEPFFMGHEVSGLIEEVGEGVTGMQVGDRVTVFSESGGYAPYVTVPAEWVVHVDDAVPLDHALGEPIGCAVNGSRRAGIQLGDTVVLIGLGFMGSLMLQLIRLQGAGKIIAVDTRDEVLQIAEELGADVTVNVSDRSAVDAIAPHIPKDGADVVIECTGRQEALDTATDIIRIRGRLIIFGYHQQGKRSIDMQTWNWKGLDVVNAHERDPKQYMDGIRTGIGLLNRGKLRMEPLVTHTFALEDINEAFQTAMNKPSGFMKAVIQTREDIE